jgi:hypothetical protein
MIKPLSALPLILTGVIVLATPRHAIPADYPPPERLPAQATFPNPLKLRSGKIVTTKSEWETTARPEISALFQHYMYGRIPKVVAKISATLLFEDKSAYDGKITLREYAVTMADNTTPVHLLLALPNQRTGAVPVFLGLNFTGNHTLTKHPKVRIPTAWMRPSAVVNNNRATEAGRGVSTRWPLATIIDRGYALATAYYGEIVPDDPTVRGGLDHLLMPDRDAQPPVPDATGAIMAWAWGLQRLADHLQTIPEIDRDRLAVVGHSRLGKTALLAAALDPRFSLTVANQSGCGGAGPSRSNNPKAETVKRITTAFPHWFAPNFSRFGDDPSRLPFDQHQLVALVAPRPVLFTCATDDQWANPAGQFEVLVAANPVYRLYGVEGITETTMPPENQLISSRLGYWIRPGKHDMTPADWQIYLQFADKWLKAPATK